MMLVVDYASPSVFEFNRERALLGVSANARRPVRFHGRVARNIPLFRFALRALGEAIWSNDTWASQGEFGSWILDPVITVHPDRFEELLADLKQVGHLTAIHVEQQDRTGQLRQLHAQRQSHKKHQDAVLKLRQTGKLSVEEALKVEQKLLEVEKEIHALGVQLGDLLGMEPSYNLFVSLREQRSGSEAGLGWGIARRLGSSLLWALGWWLLAAVATGLLVGTYVSLKTLRGTPRSAGSAPRPAQA